MLGGNIDLRAGHDIVDVLRAESVHLRVEIDIRVFAFLLRRIGVVFLDRRDAPFLVFGKHLVLHVVDGSADRAVIDGHAGPDACLGSFLRDRGGIGRRLDGDAVIAVDRDIAFDVIHGAPVGHGARCVDFDFAGRDGGGAVLGRVERRRAGIDIHPAFHHELIGIDAASKNPCGLCRSRRKFRLRLVRLDRDVLGIDLQLPADTDIAAGYGDAGIVILAIGFVAAIDG